MSKSLLSTSISMSDIRNERKINAFLEQLKEDRRRERNEPPCKTNYVRKTAADLSPLMIKALLKCWEFEQERPFRLYNLSHFQNLHLSSIAKRGLISNNMFITEVGREVGEHLTVKGMEAIKRIAGHEPNFKFSDWLKTLKCLVPQPIVM